MLLQDSGVPTQHVTIPLKIIQAVKNVRVMWNNIDELKNKHVSGKYFLFT